MSDCARPRILLVSRNLPPLWGGMERLNWHMVDELAKYASVRVVGPSGSGAQAPANVEVDEAPLKPLATFLLSAQWLAVRAARKWRPHIVLAGSGLAAPLALLAARTCGAKAVTYVHGLDVGVRHPIYRAIWLPTLRRMYRVIANSRATAQLTVEVGCQPPRVGIVHPGVDFSDALPNESNIRAFRAQINAGDRPIILSVGRLTRRKGMCEFVADVLPRIVMQCPEVLLVIIGDAPTNSLFAKSQTPQSIQAAADAAGVGQHVYFAGVVLEDERLAAAYEAADAHVFPVRFIPGDPEGFGMVAVEAAAHGLPTVAYATGGVVDAVADGQSGCLVGVNDHIGFADAVIDVLRKRDAMRDGCIRFARDFAWPRFGEKLFAELTR